MSENTKGIPLLPLDALQAVCSVDAARVHKIGSPFTMEIGGEAWTVGTDGRRLLGVRHDYGARKDNLPDENVIRATHAMVARGDVVQIAALRDFFAANVPAPEGTCPECNGFSKEDCMECNGDGEVECECECECGHVHYKDCKACKGTGGFRCKRCANHSDIVEVRVDGVTYNALLAAPLFALLPEGEARFIQSDFSASTRPSVIGCDDWFAVLMPLRDGAPDAPSLTLARKVAA